MNKLEVAIKLIQLLNERTTISAKVIAGELGVSIRTAQRYIRELSNLPCLVHQHNSTVYEIYPDYKFKEALLHSSFCDIIQRKMQLDATTGIGDVFCLICSATRGKINHNLFVFDITTEDNAEKLQEIVTTIKEMLKAQAEKTGS